MRLHTLKTFLAVLASLFHLSYTAILQERFRDWENTNSILSKADQFSVTKKQNYFDNNERTFREKESEDDEVVSEHINKEYLSDNYVKHGSKAEMDSPHGVNFHKYGSKFDKDTSDKKYDTDKLTIDKDIEQRFKKLVGAEDLPVPANKLSKRYKPSRYIKELFSAMLENDVLNPHAAEPSTETPIPTIRSYRGIRGKKAEHHARSFKYDISEKSSEYSRVELVFEKTPEDDATYQLSVSIDNGGKLANDVLLKSTASRHDNYLIFDITAVAKDVVESFRPVLKLTSGGEPVRITKRNIPILVVYENMATNPLLHVTSVRKRRSHKSYIIDQVLPTIGDAFDGFNCKKYDWEIDMEIFEWSWYIAPRYYNAGYCAGACPFPLDSPVINSTTYAFIKNLFHYKTAFMDDYIPRACCTPVSYYSQPILYFDRDLNSVLKKLPNMKVAGCGCR